MLKNLLVHVPSERLIRPVVDAATSLAVSCAAHLDAVSIGYETTNIGLAVEGGAAVAAVFEIEQERALARANAALAVFETEARNAGITYKLQALTSAPVEAAASVSASARLHDLTVVLQPEPERDTFDNTIPQEILFQSGGPVLFIPYTHKGPFVSKCIGIAWDGNRLAARALRDAAPFLTRAQAITIISINEAEVPPEASATAVSAHLARHGLTARIERMSANRADIQPAILSIAADNGLDLIVMGGYGHLRLQERILGGVTRGMLQSMTVPTLMSHDSRTLGESGGWKSNLLAPLLCAGLRGRASSCRSVASAARAIATGASAFTTLRPSGHLITNAWTIGQFGIATISIADGPPCRMRIEPRSWR